MADRIRTFLFTAFTVLITVAVAIVAGPFLVFGERVARAGAKFWTRSMLWGLKAICGVTYRVEGREHIPAGAAIIASNHQSMWETIALYALVREPVIVLKQELLQVPIYGWWTVASGCIPVDRSGGAKAIRALSSASKRKLAEGAQVIVFPEGTRTTVSERPPLQPGVAAVYMAGNAPCIPAAHDSGRRWLYPGGLTSLKTPGVITLRFMPPIEPGLPRKTFMAGLAARIAAARDDIAKDGAAPAEAVSGETSHKGKALA